MKNLVIGLSLVLIILAFWYFNQNSISPNTDTKSQGDFFTNPDTKLEIGGQPQFWKSFPDSKSPQAPQVPKKEILASEKIKQQFASIAKVHIPYPKGMYFREIELDRNMLAISGFNYNHSTNLTFIVRRGTVTLTQVISYLKENSSLIPNLTPGILERLPEADPLDSNPKSGLVDNTQWEVSTDTMTYYFLFANRKDKKGSYLAIYSGSSHGINLELPEMFKVADEIRAEN